GKSGEKALGLLIALGNKHLVRKAENIRKKFKQKILNGLLELEKPENIFELDAIQYFFAEDPSLGGIIGGIAINYCIRSDKPILSLTEMNDELHISARGNHLLIEKGIDLGLAMREGAKISNGIGGGHNIAAGATIPKKEKNRFLQKVNEIVKEQLL
ncbi:MAG: phosphoesterase, partial [Thermoplasmata archaeon]